MVGEAGVNDMIGCAGMLGGWTMMWHTDLIYLVPLFAVCVAAVAGAEFLAMARVSYGWRLRDRRWASAYSYGLIPVRSGAMNRDAIAKTAVRLDLPGNAPLS